jgi:hypothetical protein
MIFKTMWSEALRGAFVQLFGCGTLPSGIALSVAVSFKAGGNPTPRMGEALAAEPSSHPTTWLMRRGAPSIYTQKDTQFYSGV